MVLVLAETDTEINIERYLENALTKRRIADGVIGMKRQFDGHSKFWKARVFSMNGLEHLNSRLQFAVAARCL